MFFKRASDLFEQRQAQIRAEALVNAVNTVDVMGRGIALAFKQRFDLNYRLYAAACHAGEVQVGRMFVAETGEAAGPRWIVNFPTKQHGRQPSQLAWVAAGRADLHEVQVDLYQPWPAEARIRRTGRLDRILRHGIC